MSEVLLEKISKHIALVTINRPDAYNAINDKVAKQMDAAVKSTENDPEVRVVILTGAGEKAFCAGADLKMIAAGKGAALSTKDNGFGGFVYAQRQKPWIAAVDGFALAGGTELCLACEMIIASKKSRFGLPEVTRGLVAGAGGMFRLPQMIPQKIANELICTGAHLDASSAFNYGLINKLVDSEEVMPVAEELAETIAKNSPNSIRTSLAFLKASYERTEAENVQASNDLFEEILNSPDAAEGTQAFVEKREPVWKS